VTAANTFAAGIAWWGDSLTRGVGATSIANTARGQLATLTGKYVGPSNAGIGGDTSTQIRTRMLAATDKHARSTIIWAGRNNPNDPVTVIADVGAMVAALGHQRFLVLSVINGEIAAEYSGGNTYFNMAVINTALLAIYGARFLNIRTTLATSYNPGIPQDVIDHGHDIVPSSLRSDPVHLNDAGYLLVAQAIQNSLSILYP